MTKKRIRQLLVTEALEIYTQTSEIPLWKSKGVQLTSENLLDNILEPVIKLSIKIL